MAKVTMGILICTLLLSGNVIGAEESTERLKTISKAVSAQLLRMKEKKRVTKSDDAKQQSQGDDSKSLSNAKITDPPALPTKSPKVEKDDQQSTENVVNKGTAVTLSGESLEMAKKKDETLQQSEKIVNKSVKLDVKKVPQTNLQKNDLLRQQIQNIVNTK